MRPWLKRVVDVNGDTVIAYALLACGLFSVGWGGTHDAPAWYMVSMPVLVLLIVVFFFQPREP